MSATPPATHASTRNAVESDADSITRTTMSGMMMEATPLPIVAKPITAPMPDANQRLKRYVIATSPPSP